MGVDALTYPGMLRIDAPGLLSTLQDSGRLGLRHLGIPCSGALVPAWQKLGNALVGNADDDPIIESFEGGLSMTVLNAPLRIAVLGAADLRLEAVEESGRRDLSPMRSHTLSAGTVVTLRTTGRYRHAVIAVHALKVDRHLGSVSTYAKAGLGGVAGKALQAGDELPMLRAPVGDDWACDAAAAELLPGSTQRPRLRVVLGPQDDHFSQAGIHTLLNGEFTLTVEADRMGARLSGPALAHRDEAARDIVSDAIVPGSIQVPGNGQAIVLLNDAQTAGGYPKIATVISIDLPLLGLCRAGEICRFEAVSTDEAIDLLRDEAARVRQRMEALTPIRDINLSSEFLLSHNLIDGVTDGHLS